MNNLTIALTLAFFALGTIVGSFISMLNYRIRRSVKGIFFGRSFCPHCKVKLNFFDLVPLLSYIFLRGKCRSCNKKISIEYFLTELVTGFLFAILFLSFNFLNGTDPLITSFWLTVSIFLMAIFFYDLKYQEIPLKLSIPVIVLGALGSYFILKTPIESIIIGGLIGKLFFYLQYIISKGKWVGLGDSDIGLAMGLILGTKLTLVALMLAYIIGSIYAIILLVTGQAKMKTALAFGPFLIIGLYISALYGQNLANWYINLTL